MTAARTATGAAMFRVDITGTTSTGAFTNTFTFTDKTAVYDAMTNFTEVAIYLDQIETLTITRVSK